MSGSTFASTKKPAITAATRPSVQRKEAHGAHTIAGVSTSVHDVLQSSGQPLDTATRVFMEPRFGDDFSRMPIHPPAAGVIQTKLAINQPGDEYEQEADWVAEQVMAAPAHTGISGAPPRIQRFSGQSNGQMNAAPASVDQALASPGRPLEPALRQDMEQRFGYDFSQVRVHSGAAAEQSARDVNANAYTVGHDMVFGTGRFAPATHEGRRLIAHELVHVAQQRGSGPAGTPHEAEARTHAAPVRVSYSSGTGVQRDDAGGASGSALHPATIDEQFVHSQYGDEGLRSYRRVKDSAVEVTEAHRVYKATGRIPQTRTPFSFIEIKEGRLMTRAERFDAMLKKQGKENPVIGDISADDRNPEYLGAQEFHDEFFARHQAEWDQCDEDHWFKGPTFKCQRKVDEKYGGAEFKNWNEARYAAARHQNQVISSKIEDVVNSGFFATIGRAAGGLIAWGAGRDTLAGSEFGATVGGGVDLGVAIYAVSKGPSSSSSSEGVEPSIRPAAITEPYVPETPVERQANQPDATPPAPKVTRLMEPSKPAFGLDAEVFTGDSKSSPRGQLASVSLDSKVGPTFQPKTPPKSDPPTKPAPGGRPTGTQAANDNADQEALAATGTDPVIIVKGSTPPPTSVQPVAMAGKKPPPAPPKAKRPPKSSKPPEPPKTPKVDAPGTPQKHKPSTPKQTEAQKDAKYSDNLDKRIARVRNEILEKQQRTVEYKDARVAAGENKKGGPAKAMWNKYEELYVLNRARAHPDRIIGEQVRLVGVKGADGKITPGADIAGENRILDFLEIDGTKVLGGEVKSKAEIVHSVDDLHGSNWKAGDFKNQGKTNSKVGYQREKEQMIIDFVTEHGGNLMFKGTNVRTGEDFELEVDLKDYNSTVVAYDQISPD